MAPLRYVALCGSTITWISDTENSRVVVASVVERESVLEAGATAPLHEDAQRLSGGFGHLRGEIADFLHGLVGEVQKLAVSAGLTGLGEMGVGFEDIGFSFEGVLITAGPRVKGPGNCPGAGPLNI